MSTDTPTSNGADGDGFHDGLSAADAVRTAREFTAADAARFAGVSAADALRAEREVSAADGIAPGPWLPDEATLTRLASDLYGELTAAQTGRLAQPAQPAPAPIVVPGFGEGTVPPPTVPRVATTEITGAPDAVLAEALTAGAQAFYFVSENPQGSGGTPESPAASAPPFDVEAVRADFPILSERLHGRPLVYLDNAATTHKPQAVIDRLAYFYASENSNVHRGAHALAERATRAYEDARAAVASFLGAASADDIVFTRGTTESINLAAQSWGRSQLTAGDEIVVTHLEHHANIVPWQLLAEQTGAVLKVAAIDDDGQVLLDSLTSLLGDRTRIVAVSQVSNVLGTVVPVEAIIEAAHGVGAVALVDGAQAVAHMPVDVQAMNADFYAFSGHKVFGPTGIGALYAKPEILAGMPPWQGGGNMISDVSFERTQYRQPPAKFEAGTANIAGAVGLGAALGYLRQLGLPAVAGYEHGLLEYAQQAMNRVPGLTMIGTAPQRASVLSFALDGYPPDEVASFLDNQGIAVRAGHHCAQPTVRRYGLEAVVRPSLAMYNTHAEVDVLAAALQRLATDRGRRR
jgi:cysteine desulfurase / selenocysteine lyase